MKIRAIVKSILNNEKRNQKQHYLMAAFLVVAIVWGATMVYAAEFGRELIFGLSTNDVILFLGGIIVVLIGYTYTSGIWDVKTTQRLSTESINQRLDKIDDKLNLKQDTSICIQLRDNCKFKIGEG